MAVALVEALTAWAGRHSGLAAALDYAPPACAVEDLMIIKGGRLAAFRATNELSAVIRDVCSSGPAPDGPNRSLPEPSPTQPPDQVGGPGVLGEKERPALVLLSRGLKEEDVAAKLGLSVLAVRRYLATIMEATPHQPEHSPA